MRAATPTSVLPFFVLLLLFYSVPAVPHSRAPQDGVLGGSRVERANGPGRLIKIDSLIKSGDLLQASERLEKLIAKYQKRRDGQNLSIAFELQGELRLRQGRRQDAIDAYRSALHLEPPHSPEADRLQGLVRQLELEEYSAFLSDFSRNIGAYDRFVESHSNYITLSTVRRDRDEMCLRQGRNRMSGDEELATIFLLRASQSEFDDIRTEGRALLVSLQRDFLRFLAGVRALEDPEERASQLRSYEPQPREGELLNELLGEVINAELEQTEFMLYVQRGDVSTIRRYLSSHKQTLSEKQGRQQEVFGIYARAVARAFPLALFAEVFELPYRDSSKLEISLSKGFAGGSTYWFDLFINGALQGKLNVPYRRAGEQGRKHSFNLPRGSSFSLAFWEESFPIFAPSQVRRHSQASLFSREETNPLFNYVGVMNRETGLRLCINKVPAFKDYDHPTVQRYIQDVEEYLGRTVPKPNEVCPQKTLPTPLTLGNLMGGVKALAPALGAGVDSLRGLIRANSDMFGEIGHLYLVTGSLCGDGTIEVTGATNKRLDCCGWGNLGAQSYALPPGQYHLSMSVSTCSGKRRQIEGVDFEIVPKTTTEVNILLDSGTFSARQY